MKDESQDSNNFLSWAKQVSAQHPDILAQMRKSLDPLDRAISRRIMEIAGGCENA
jgi:hypothetical protein